MDHSSYEATFYLDPMKCINNNAKLKIEEGDNNTIFVNLTGRVAFNWKLIDVCLNKIKIFYDDNTEVLDI